MRPFALASAVRGLPVVARQEGSFVGKLDDFLVRVEGLEVIGYKLRSPGLFSSARGVAASAVEKLGHDYVIVTGEAQVEQAGTSRGALEEGVWWSDWSGVRGIVRRGAEVGRLHDLVLARDGSSVRGFLLDGNRLVAPGRHCAVGHDSLILESEAAAVRLPAATDSPEWWKELESRINEACAPNPGR